MTAIQSIRKFSLGMTCVGLIACQHPLVYQWVEIVLQAKPEDLNAEVATLPAAGPIKAGASFHSEMTPEVLLSGGTSKELTGAPFRLAYPAGKMLQQAGDAATQRWFASREGIDNGKEIAIKGRIEDLYYHDVSMDPGTSRALVAVRIHILATQGKKILVDEVYESGRQYGAYFKAGVGLRGTGEQYETQYSRTVYKALLVALDKAMADVGLKESESLEKTGSERNFFDPPPATGGVVYMK